MIDGNNPAHAKLGQFRFFQHGTFESPGNQIFRIFGKMRGCPAVGGFIGHIPCRTCRKRTAFGSGYTCPKSDSILIGQKFNFFNAEIGIFLILLPGFIFDEPIVAKKNALGKKFCGLRIGCCRKTGENDTCFLYLVGLALCSNYSPGDPERFVSFSGVGNGLDLAQADQQ